MQNRCIIPVSDGDKGRCGRERERARRTDTTGQPVGVVDGGERLPSIYLIKLEYLLWGVFCVTRTLVQTNGVAFWL